MPSDPLSDEQQQADAARRAIIMAHIYAKNTRKARPAQTNNNTAPLRMIVPPRLPATHHRPAIVDEDEEGESGSGRILIHLFKGVVLIILGVMLYLVLANASRHATSTAIPTTPTVIPYAIAPEVPVRLNQFDPLQYRDTDEYATWAESASSPAAMAEIINAYASDSGHTYRIADLLEEEIRQHQIAQQSGIVNGEVSIQKTVAKFGFQAHALHNPSLDDVLSVANGGTPVIIEFRDPHDFPGGHVLVMRGGNTHTIYLTDSSKLNLTSMPRSRFLSTYWHGFAVVVTPLSSR